MSADPAYNFALPCLLFGPMNTSIKFVDLYRRISTGFAFVLSAATSFVLALVSGILGGFAAMYLYDRGMSRGNDLAVGLGGLFAVGTFTFVVVYTWLQKVHHSISSRTSSFAFCACLTLPTVSTVLSLSEMDEHYLLFVLGDWLVILVLGLLSLFVCRRWWDDSHQGL